MAGRILGLDIGGANLKAADGRGWAASVRFPLWREPEHLPHQLLGLATSHPEAADRDRPWELIALTMTGELCDCFADRAEGVGVILDAVARVFPETPQLVWSHRGDFLTPDQARVRPLEVASANWLASAAFCSRLLTRDDAALVVDIGSTTTDLTPIRHGNPVPIGRTDLERLQTGELVYRGVRRTPLMALAEHVGFGGRFTGVMAERFATTHDLYLILGDFPEEPDCRETADGRPATREFARRRLARMVGTDAQRHGESDLLDLARQFDDAMRRPIRNALWRVLARALPGSQVTAIVCGSGEFLARRILGETGCAFTEVISLSERLGPKLSESICAHAVAVLAKDRR
jgi:probable H4MPT-linked C1 transfer pathway protein